MKKIIILCVIVLFISVGFASGIGVNVEQTSYPLNVGELAWWKFDETSGNTAHDSSGHGYDGTVYGATWTGDGLIFDGVDDYVDFDNHSVALGMNKTDDYVFMIRFKSTGSGMLYSMSHTNPDRAYFDLMLDEDGKITVEIGDETCLFTLSSSITVDDDDWHLVEIYFEGSTTNPTLEIYVDGELDDSKTDWMPPMLDEDFLTAKVGRDSNTEEDYFDGYIDDIKIYKNICCGTPPEAPKVWWSPKHPKPFEMFTLTFNSVDPDGDDVRFLIDWDDGTTETTVWVGSGINKTLSHTAGPKRTYYINVTASDGDGMSDVTTVKIIVGKSKAVTGNMLLLRILERFPLLQRLLDVWRFNS